MRTGVPFAASLAALALGVSSGAYAQKPEHYQLRNAGDLVRVCATEPSASDYATATAFCHGVLAGAYGYYDASTPPAERFICPPEPRPSRTKVAGDFVAWGKARPQLMQSHAVDTFIRFAAEAYPCKK